METLREAIYLLASSLDTAPTIQRELSFSAITPQTTACCLIQRFFERPQSVDNFANYTNNQNGSAAPSSIATSSTSNAPSSTPTTPSSKFLSPKFTTFSHLPVELRRCIWKHAAESVEPRIIPIEPDDDFEDAGHGFRCVARAGSPDLLSTCSEARSETLRVYHLKFHAQLRRPVYFNPEKDTLLMSRTSSMFSFLQSTYEFERLTHDEFDRGDVKFLAMLVNDTEVNFWGEDALHGYPSWRQVSMAAITFANLRELRLIYRRENDEYSPGFQREKDTLGMFWTRHWSSWQQLRARALLVTQNLILNPRASKIPEFVFWSREQLEGNLPDMERWAPENFNRRSRGSPEPLYGRSQTSFFEGFS